MFLGWYIPSTSYISSVRFPESCCFSTLMIVLLSIFIWSSYYVELVAGICYRPRSFRFVSCPLLSNNRSISIGSLVDVQPVDIQWFHIRILSNYLDTNFVYRFRWHNDSLFWQSRYTTRLFVWGNLTSINKRNKNWLA